MKPTISKQMIRRKIRTALNVRPGTGKTEGMLLEMVNDLIGGGVSRQELRDAIEYNHGEHFIRSEFNRESEETEWFITAEGIAQEKIK